MRCLNINRMIKISHVVAARLLRDRSSLDNFISFTYLMKFEKILTRLEFRAVVFVVLWVGGSWRSFVAARPSSTGVAATSLARLPIMFHCSVFTLASYDNKNKASVIVVSSDCFCLSTLSSFFTS